MDKSTTFGFTCWFTGLPSSGKSTIASGLAEILNHQNIPCELLDGAVIRTTLSRGLGFSLENRNTNVARVGFVCKLLNKYDISTIVAMVSPYQEARDRVRHSLANFIEIYVSTPLEMCIARDAEGLYKRALAGEISEFTGVSDPYEIPLNPELILKPHEQTPEQCIEKVLSYLSSRNFVPQYNYT